MGSDLLHGCRWDKRIRDQQGRQWSGRKDSWDLLWVLKRVAFKMERSSRQQDEGFRGKEIWVGGEAQGTWLQKDFRGTRECESLNQSSWKIGFNICLDQKKSLYGLRDNPLDRFNLPRVLLLQRKALGGEGWLGSVPRIWRQVIYSPFFCRPPFCLSQSVHPAQREGLSLYASCFFATPKSHWIYLKGFLKQKRALRAK